MPQMIASMIGTHSMEVSLHRLYLSEAYMLCITNHPEWLYTPFDKFTDLSNTSAPNMTVDAAVSQVQ